MNTTYSESSHYARSSNAGAGAVNAALGVWLIISTFVLTFFHGMYAARWNNVIVGILVGLFSVVRLSTNAARCWSWSSFILGLWMIASPFVLGFSHMMGAMWHNIILGIVIGLLAVARALAAPRELL